MEEYKPNSYKSKEVQKTNVPEKRATKVVTGPVKVKKKSELAKFADTFIAEDAENVKSYIWEGVVIPTIKDTFFEIITGGLSMLLFGKRTGSSKTSTGSKISYTSYYGRDRDRDVRRDDEPRSRSRFDYEDIVIPSRGEAEGVLIQMEELIDRYKVCSVLDLYDMLDRTAPYTADRFGWTSIRNARVERVRDGYMLRLPKVLPLD